jgi:hypothetical protein
VAWTDQTRAPSPAHNQNWSSVATSFLNGTDLAMVAAANGGDLWTGTSSNSGTSWTWTDLTVGGATASGQDWTGVASDSTGTHLAACTFFYPDLPKGGDLWTYDGTVTALAGAPGATVTLTYAGGGVFYVTAATGVLTVE